MSDKPPNDDYVVGYKRPPVATRFQPGNKCNPKGRPRGSKNLKTIVQQEAVRRVTIVEGGKRKKVQAFEALMRQLSNKALNGDLRAIAIVLGLNERHAEDTLRPGHAAPQFSNGDLMKNLLARVRRDQPRVDEGGEGSSQ